jgi:hypothetical protein
MWRDNRALISLAACLALGLWGCARPNPAYEPSVESPPDATTADLRSMTMDAAPRDGSRGPDADPSADATPAADAHIVPDAAMTTPDAPTVSDGAVDRAPVVNPPDAMPSLASGLLGYWSMDETASSPVAHDSSGHHNDGTLESIDPTTAWVPGHGSGTALLVQGGSNRVIGVRVENTPEIQALQHFTVAAWFYYSDSSTTAFRAMISRQLGDTDNELFYLGIVRSFLKCYVPVPPTGNYGAVATEAAPSNVWSHAAETFDGATVRLYFNGQEIGNFKYTVTLPTDITTPLYLGTNKNLTNLGEPFTGRLDDIVLYSRALSAEEIRLLARGEHP